ncbi:MAG: YkgJ family cysteine cluster protein [Thermoplasmatota archaeon]
MHSHCLKYRCFQCCTKTNMLLTIKDIKIITQQGYETDFFVKQNNGWLQLKNTDNRCVFHNGKHCTIYTFRPTGCRLYPLVYQNDDSTAIYDKECPHPDYFPLTDDLKKQLFLLVSVLKKERAQRIKTHKK